MQQSIKVGDSVYNKRRVSGSYKLQGVVVKVEEGCNPVYWVDCGLEFLTIMCALDIELNN
jgi:hypothetical protein